MARKKVEGNVEATEAVGVEVKKPEKLALMPLVEKYGLVDYVKAQRAYQAVYGGAKPGSAELAQVMKLRGEFSDSDLVVEVYRGLLGLIDQARAQKNRENEALDRKRKASR